MSTRELKSGLGVRISPENLAELRAAAAARNESVTWYVLTRLGLEPVEGQNGRTRAAKPSTAAGRLSRVSRRLPVQFTAAERERIHQAAEAIDQTLSQYVHAKLAIHRRDIGRPGHRRT